MIMSLCLCPLTDDTKIALHLRDNQGRSLSSTAVDSNNCCWCVTSLRHVFVPAGGGSLSASCFPSHRWGTGPSSPLSSFLKGCVAQWADKDVQCLTVDCRDPLNCLRGVREEGRRVFCPEIDVVLSNLFQTKSLRQSKNRVCDVFFMLWLYWCRPEVEKKIAVQIYSFLYIQ